MITATLQEHPDCFVIRLPTSQIQFPFTNSTTKQSQLAAAREYIAEAQRAGAKIKLKGLEKSWKNPT